MNNTEKEFYNGVDMSEYQAFSLSLIGETFTDLGLLLSAFTHRSYVNEHKKGKFKNNERLEFLGDAVLELIVTKYLFKTYPDQPEGILTAWRSALVKTESISEVASKLEMDKLLRLSKGEKLSISRSRQQIMANTFEAFLGAVYLEKGFKLASVFVKNNLIVTMKQILEEESWKDAKSVLQEKVQTKFGMAPKYKVVDEVGPDHDKIFKIAVIINGKKVASAEGHSKQSAQQKAAALALKGIE
jgi:ribonuclease-3